MDEQQITILIADDHPVVRAGLAEIIHRRAEFRLIAECANGSAALEAIRELRPDVSILDIEMPELSGLDIATVVRRDQLPTRIIILTMSDREELVGRALECGVCGYVLKDSAVIDLVDSIHTVMRGSRYVSAPLAHLAQRHVGECRNGGDGNGVRAQPHRRDGGVRSLTPTEKTVLRFIAENKTSEEIADLMSVSVRTIHTHRENIARKLDLHGAYALLRHALQHQDDL